MSTEGQFIWGLSSVVRVWQLGFDETRLLMAVHLFFVSSRFCLGVARVRELVTNKSRGRPNTDPSTRLAELRSPEFKHEDTELIEGRNSGENLGWVVSPQYRCDVFCALSPASCESARTFSIIKRNFVVRWMAVDLSCCEHDAPFSVCVLFADV